MKEHLVESSGFWLIRGLLAAALFAKLSAVLPL
jgi:hypothetical protein